MREEKREGKEERIEEKGES
jgi:hypothetical protein